MTFWDAFWATMWGALAGAVIGALAAYVFSRDLARRDRAARAVEDAARRKADENARYVHALTDAIVRIIAALHAFAAEAGQQINRTGAHQGSRASETPATARASADLKAAIDAGSARARGDHWEVFFVLYQIVASLPHDNVAAARADLLANALAMWDVQREGSGDDVIGLIQAAGGNTHRNE
jgi:gas vesicle protein